MLIFIIIQSLTTTLFNRYNEIKKDCLQMKLAWADSPLGNWNFIKTEKQEKVNGSTGDNDEVIALVFPDPQR